MCICVFPACLSVHAWCRGGQKKTLDSLELPSLGVGGVWGVVVGVGNQACIFC